MLKAKSENKVNPHINKLFKEVIKDDDIVSLNFKIPEKIRRKIWVECANRGISKKEWLLEKVEGSI